MIKTETSLRASIYTRIQLLLWETVIRTVDFARNVRDGVKQPRPPQLKLPAMTARQVIGLGAILILGASSGLITGAVFAFLFLFR